PPILGAEGRDVRIEDGRPDGLESPRALDEIELHGVGGRLPILDEVGEVVALEDIRGTQAVGPAPGDELATDLEGPPFAIEAQESLVGVDSRPLLLREVLS